MSLNPHARHRVLDFTRAHHLTLALNLALDAARACAGHLDDARGLDSDVVFTHDYAVNIARALTRVVDPDLALAPDLARTLIRAIDLAKALAAHPAPDQRGDVQEIIGLLKQARRNVGLLVKAREDPAAGRPVVRVSGWARRLVGVASRVVPVWERARYEEEWRCELWELGRQRRGHRRRQIAHALRLLSRAWGVRGGVRAVRRRPAGG